MHRSNFATMAIAFISLIAASVASIAGLRRLFEAYSWLLGRSP
jgi:hypothetical protein